MENAVGVDRSDDGRHRIRTRDIDLVADCAGRRDLRDVCSQTPVHLEPPREEGLNEVAADEAGHTRDESAHRREGTFPTTENAPGTMKRGGMERDSTADVEALMGEVRRRVAEKRASGLYAIDSIAQDRGRTNAPYRADDLADVARLADVYPDFSLVKSTKPGVGSVVGKMKSGLSRATSQPLLGVADQASGFNNALVGYIAELAQEVAALRAEVNTLRERGGG